MPATFPIHMPGTPRGIVCKHSSPRRFSVSSRLSDKGAGGSRLVLPGGGKDTDGLVVTGQTVDTGLDENQAELGVLVLAVALEVLADGNGLVGVLAIARPCGCARPIVYYDFTHLLDEHVKVLGDLGGEACIKSLRQSETKQRRNLTFMSCVFVPTLASSHLPLRTFFHAG